MSVYIKGMDMPVDCMACRIACDKENYGVIGRPPKCPLAEAPVGDLIRRADAIEAVRKEYEDAINIGDNGDAIAYDVEKILSELPSADAVSKGVLEQFRWERDVAMDQLEEYGIPFGTDKDEDTVRVVRCKDCRFWKNEHLCLVMSRYGSIDTKADHYCSWGERREP